MESIYGVIIHYHYHATVTIWEITTDELDIIHKAETNQAILPTIGMSFHVVSTPGSIQWSGKGAAP